MGGWVAGWLGGWAVFVGQQIPTMSISATQSVYSIYQPSS